MLQKAKGSVLKLILLEYPSQTGWNPIRKILCWVEAPGIVSGHYLQGGPISAFVIFLGGVHDLKLLLDPHLLLQCHSLSVGSGPWHFAEATRVGTAAFAGSRANKCSGGGQLGGLGLTATLALVAAALALQTSAMRWEIAD